MNKKKKITLIISIALVSIILIMGVSYAALSYTTTSSNQQLILGDIWMKYTETSGLTIEDAMPGADYTNYFEFTISGKNTYTKKDIYYDFILNKGDLLEGKTEDNRIPDEYLKFKLVSVDENGVETEIFADKTYTSLESQRIHVEKIEKNTETEVNRKYRLYMTIDNSLLIGNTNDAVFTLEEWPQAFASIKLNVTGDFTEKELVETTDESCFNASKIITSYTLNTSEEAVSVCSTYLEQQGFTVDGTYENYCRGTQEDIIKEDLDNYIFNNDTSYFDVLDIKYFINNNVMTNVEYEAVIIGYDATCGPDVVIPSTIAGYKVTKLDAHDYSSNALDYLTSNRVSNTYVASVDIGCGTFVETTYYGSFIGLSLNSVIIPNTVSYIGVREFGYLDLASIEIPKSVITIGSFAFENSNLQSVTFEENSNLQTIGSMAFRGTNLTSIEIPNSIITIGSSAFENLNLQSVTFEENSKLQTIKSGAFSENDLTSVKIPNSVITIGSYAFWNSNLQSVTFEENSKLQTIEFSAFENNDLTSVEIPDSVTDIGSNAFSENDLTSVKIPNSVEYIGSDAFSFNELTTVEIGNGIKYIDEAAFLKSSDSNSNLESITFTGKTCEEIRIIPSDSSDHPFKYFPWLDDYYPYYVYGDTTTIIGTDGECL